MLLIIDNYDSFTFNLAHYFAKLGQAVKVVRNDQITLEQIAQLQPDYLVISPGPCTPNESGISLAAIERFQGQIPILGVCLGHQSVGQFYGGHIVRAQQPIHGKTSLIQHRSQGIFVELNQPLQVMRYHSLVIEAATLPDCLEVTAWTVNDNGDPDEIMGVRHKTLPLEGVQFHPESILTQQGHALLQNFLQRYAPCELADINDTGYIEVLTDVSLVLAGLYTSVVA